ncbi:MAG: alpha/beta hydrolase, partial [Candidatus Cryptobacteroides sp.]
MKPLIIKIFTLVSILLATAVHEGFAQTVTEPDATYLYAKRDTCDLFMSVYEPSATALEKEGKPLVLFMFGGGFQEGNRDSEWYQEWFSQLNTNGYRVISIDYRLGLKGVEDSISAKASRLGNAIHIAVEDLFSATEFIIDNAESLGVDPERIVISG